MQKIPTLSLVIAAALVISTSPGLTDIGQIKTVKGDVKTVRGAKTLSAKAGDTLEQHDALVTGTDSSVGMTFIDGTQFSAGPNSNVELSRFKFNPTTLDGAFETKINRGTLAIISGRIAKRSPDAMKVRTPASILEVRGTRFLVKVGGEE